MRNLDIAEVVKQSGIPASTLRFYEEKGLVSSIGRRGLRRLFDAGVLERLALISLGRSAGFSLEEIALMFAPDGRPRINRQMLTAKAEELDKTIRKLSAMRDGLRHAANCPAPSHMECPKFRRFLQAAASGAIGPHKTVSRRRVLGGLTMIAGAVALGMRPARAQESTPLSDEQRAAGVDFLRRYPSVDMHCHPGRFFLDKLPYETPTTHALGEPFEQKAAADLEAGNVSGALFSAVADMRLLEMTPTGGLHAAQDFKPGEAYADYKRQIGVLRTLLENRDLTKGLSPSDIEAAHQQHKTATVFAVEGGDFIEDRLDRVHQAFRDGVRAVTIVHYHINQIGDIQTEPPVHHGLTPLGKSIVREMNHVGLIIDLAHATFDVTKDALEVSGKPVMVSHTNLQTPTANHPRLITIEHARLVASAGGVIGSWPSGAGQASLSDYIDSIRRLVDAVGTDHVAIGTDMDANYKPVLTSYRDWSLIPASLLARGMHEKEVAAIMGGNFQRLFRANLVRS